MYAEIGMGFPFKKHFTVQFSFCKKQKKEQYYWEEKKSSFNTTIIMDFIFTCAEVC